MNYANNMEKLLGYKFNNPMLLKEALTHSSYGWTDENGVRIDNERLEFIGDAFVDSIVGVEIYKRLPNDSKEGELTKMRAKVVCERTLAKVGKDLGIGAYISMGVGEEKTGGREKDSIIADTLEAIVGAMYIDGGYDAVSDFIRDKFTPMIDAAIDGKLVVDYKTELQEKVQRAGKTIKYVVDKSEGPDHDKTFYIHIEIDEKPYTSGVGKNKKEAQQQAAQKLVEEGLDFI